MLQPSYRPIASAGSLAVILQPAFVPFVWAADYLLYVPLLPLCEGVACLCDLKSCLFIFPAKLSMGKAAAGINRLRLAVSFILPKKSTSNLSCEFVSKCWWFSVNNFACECACSNLIWIELKFLALIPCCANQASVYLVSNSSRVRICCAVSDLLSLLFTALFSKTK